VNDFALRGHSGFINRVPCEPNAGSFSCGWGLAADVERMYDDALARAGFGTSANKEWTLDDVDRIHGELT
jgi:hypothetical protein